MPLTRPDLSAVSPDVLAYIAALEVENERLSASPRLIRSESEPISTEPAEPPTTFNLVTLSLQGQIKRTPRHLYPRQRRGGMGIFDIETASNDRPCLLALADAAADLILITSRGRTFRLPVAVLTEAPVRGRGQPLATHLPLLTDERVACMLPADGGSYLVVVSERGQVRRYSAHLFGAAMRPGVVVHDINYGGPPAAACWTAGDDDLFIATRAGNAIRFAEKQTPVRGCLGIRLERDDAVVAVAAVNDASHIFLLSADGKGAWRQMAGFRPNKEPGAGGKAAMKTDALIGAIAADQDDDIFILSRLSKIIRFGVAEVPAKEGAVQGVNCMELRADETVAVIASPLPP